MMEAFDASAAFARNLGWVTEAERDRLAGACVALAGLGGVGGSHLLTLVRLGIGRFRIADPDTFETANFNRQAGASRSTVGEAKIVVLERLARDINPNLEITCFPEGVTSTNLDDFLDGADVYLDGLDFFALDIRRRVFAACARRGIPAVTAAPLGMGAALLVFQPGGMGFEEYFRFADHPDEDPAAQALRFLVGLAPAMLHRAYLVEPERVDLVAGRGPSTPMACELCAGVAATEVLKLLLHRGRVRAAPWGMQFDAYRGTSRWTYRPCGNHHPLQRLTLGIARRVLKGAAARRAATTESRSPASPLERILDQARWAPSGDNTQPWRFEIAGDDHLVVHGHDTRTHCLYDFDGRASQIALGALLESLVLAASAEGRSARIERRTGLPDETPTFDVHLASAPVTPPPLAAFLRLRATDRRPFRTRALTGPEKAELDRAAGPEHAVVWFEGWSERARWAELLFRNGRIRLTTPEAFEVHRSIIEWNARTSIDRIPDRAVGLDPLATRLMRFALGSWSRTAFLNRWLGGTLLPGIELDLLPALGCAAHFALIARTPPRTVDDYVTAGRALQRFWLTATRLGLHLQPSMTPLVFSWYVRAGRPFTREPGPWRAAQSLATRLTERLGSDLDHAVFLGRIGEGRRPVTARSLRRPLAELRT